MIRRSVLTIAIVLLAAAPAAAADLENILQKVYEARGGLSHLKSVESARMTGSYAVVGMMEASITIEWKRPDKVRFEFSTAQGDGIQAFDGKTAWAVMPGIGGAQELAGEQAAALRRQADLLDGPLVDWRDKGHAVKYLGEGELDGVAVHKLELVRAGEPAMTIFVDAGSFLPIRQSGTMQTQGMETEVETFIEDYRKVGALTIAHSVKNELIDVGMTQLLTMDTIELNVDLSDDRFAMPAPAAPPSAVPPAVVEQDGGSASAR